MNTDTMETNRKKRNFATEETILDKASGGIEEVNSSGSEYLPKVNKKKKKIGLFGWVGG